MATEDPSREIYTRLFYNLKNLIPDLFVIGTKGLSVIANGESLYLDVQSKQQICIVIILAQYYKSTSGDWIPTPEMEIAVYPLQQTAEVLVCHEPDSRRQVYGENRMTKDAQAEMELNCYLDRWLIHLIEQGHCIKVGEIAEE